MNRKVMFFDIDGTLLPSGAGEFTPSAIKAIRKAKENGHLMFLNTGRVVANMESFMFDDAFNGFVCACGTYILIDGVVRVYRHNSAEVCSKIISLAKKHHLDIVFESWHGVYGNPEELKTPEAKKLTAELFRRGQMIFNVPADLQFDKFVTWERSDSDLNGFIDAVKDHFNYIDRKQGFGEYVPCGYSKATGIQFVLDEFGLPLESAHAIGDSTNDLPMLRYVPHSIAMGNSNPVSLFDEVEYVTADINDDGIEKALRHFNFI